ncbi:MAG: putative metal-dependent hydrolase [Maribacter sp.]|nr:putative metal-dependent hydrolase [Maribacter sp.]
MRNMIEEQLRYPIGHFQLPETITEDLISEWIQTLEALPAKLTALVKNLSSEQLDTPYRSGGWTIRQLIHHLADSHHHSYTRFKWALTEDRPVIKAYEEKDWSNLIDAQTAPIELSLEYLKTLHAKMVFLLRGLSEEELKRVYIHPDGFVEVTIAENIGKYAWHGRHHFAHIEGLLKRENWV